jgi:hypothetical protein
MVWRIRSFVKQCEKTAANGNLRNRRFLFWRKGLPSARGVLGVRPQNRFRGFTTVAGLPNAALLEAVEQALHGHGLMGFDTQIKAPDVTDITVAVEFAGDADRAEVMLVTESCVHGLGTGGRFAIRELCALPKPFNRAA